MTRNKAIWMMALVAAIWVGGSALASGGMPTLPPEVEEAVSAGAVVSLVDADGNVIWQSDSGLPLDPELMAQAAAVVVVDADGNVVAELPVTEGPGGNPVVAVDDETTYGLGAFLHKALGVKLADGEGEGEMVQSRERKTEQKRVTAHEGESSDEAGTAEGSGEQHQHHGESGKKGHGSSDG